MFREIWFLHPLPHSQSASPLNLHPTYLPQIPSPRSQPRGPRLTHCPRPPGQGCLAEGLLPPIEQGWGTEHKPRSSASVGDQGHLHITLGPPTSAQGHLHITLGPLHLCPGSPAYHSLGSPPHTHTFVALTTWIHTVHLPVQCGHWPWFLSQYTEKLRQLPQAI